jgi:hypothetical protein
VPVVNELDLRSVSLIVIDGWQRLFIEGGGGRLGNSVGVVTVERTLLAAGVRAPLKI